LMLTVLDTIGDYMNLASHDILILNRLKGTVTLHEYRFLNKEITVYPFGKIEIEVCNLETIYVRNNKYSNQKVPVLCISGRNPWFLTTLFEIREDKVDCYISFFVWYMDKNRPLPPHTFFDPYREKDYKRRKAEGFPPPIYPSEIPIPEYKER
ncbi:MAG: hypothetical protein LUG98_01935, partial [Tannerellaceae bacterium]|nr:hypothetical protein [Tannerellaceae bacterium]